MHPSAAVQIDPAPLVLQTPVRVVPAGGAQLLARIEVHAAHRDAARRRVSPFVVDVVSDAVQPLHSRKLLLQAGVLPVGVPLAEEDVPSVVEVGGALVLVMEAGQEDVGQREDGLPQLFAEALHDPVDVWLEVVSHHHVLVHDSHWILRPAVVAFVSHIAQDEFVVRSQVHHRLALGLELGELILAVAREGVEQLLRRALRNDVRPSLQILAGSRLVPHNRAVDTALEQQGQAVDLQDERVSGAHSQPVDLRRLRAVSGIAVDAVAGADGVAIAAGLQRQPLPIQPEGVRRVRGLNRDDVVLSVSFAEHGRVVQHPLVS
mmetsp:Transcript_92986/g.240252  ORF Transcript_92986/g.240252 Transcript_92986/m.240252 type:complete len:319 (+) Transcript_92986:318-1274(+)